MKVKPLLLIIPLLLCFLTALVLGASENFGVDWTEHNDPENKLVVSGTSNETLTWTAVNRSDSCYYLRNYTQADYEVWFDFEVTEAEAGDASVIAWAILWRGAETNVTTGGQATQLAIRQDTGVDDFHFDLLFSQYDGGWDFQIQTTVALNVGQEYFANVSQSGTTYYCDVYSTALLRLADGGGDIWDTQGAAGNDHTYHYWFVVLGKDSGADPGDWTSGYITEFDFDPPTIVDITTPLYHYPYGLNSTLNGSVCQFTVNFTDETGLTNALLSWNNSGSWANVSYTLTGTVDLALWNQTLNATSGYRIEYLFYVNDTSNNWNTTLQHFIYTNTKPIVLVVSDAGVLFIGFILVFSLLGGIFMLGRRKR